MLLLQITIRGFFMPDKTFHKTERLKSRKRISELFNSGLTGYSNPVKVLWKYNDEQRSVTLKAGFAVPKKNFKHATDRNRLKRRMREAYRLFCDDLKKVCTEKNIQLDIMFIFISSGNESYSVIEGAIRKLLTKIEKEVNN